MLHVFRVREMLVRLSSGKMRIYGSHNWQNMVMVLSPSTSADPHFTPCRFTAVVDCSLCDITYSALIASVCFSEYCVICNFIVSVFMLCYIHKQKKLFERIICRMSSVIVFLDRMLNVSLRNCFIAFYPHCWQRTAFWKLVLKIKSSRYALWDFGRNICRSADSCSFEECWIDDINERGQRSKLLCLFAAKAFVVAVECAEFLRIFTTISAFLVRYMLALVFYKRLLNKLNC